MKNYYEILEVDKNASQEVIDKAYRTLAKKYHPDLQRGAIQNEYAEKMKIINQAYDVLSDNAKRQAYNQKLENERIQQERMQAEAIARQQQERIMQENYKLKQQLNRFGTNQQDMNVGDNTIVNMSRILNQQINAARKQAYYDAYIQDMQNRGYKVRYKHDLKYYFKLILTLALTVLVLFLIYQIPPVKNFCAELYKENEVFRVIVDIFKNTLSASF
jgi:curved DNA-binding protein CbpA